MRGIAVALSLGLVAGCADLQMKEADEGPRSRVFVANESSNSVTVVDGDTFQVIATVESRNHATHDLAVSRDGRWLFATNLASGRLSAINTRALETVASIATGDRAHVVTLTNDNRQAWVANIGDNTISIVDTSTFRILGTIAVGKGPTGLTFSRDGRFAYVSNQGDKTVEVIDTTSHRVLKAIPVGTNPHFLVLGPDGRIWGTNTGGTDIYVIDPATQDKVGAINGSRRRGRSPSGSGAPAGPERLRHRRGPQPRGGGQRGSEQSPHPGADRRRAAAERDLEQPGGDAALRGARDLERLEGHRHRQQLGPGHGAGGSQADSRRLSRELRRL
jgi:YVTN family beta-propeller protein